MSTYSFLDVNASINGPGGAINLGSGAGVHDEGITIEAETDIDVMTLGADGTPMHSLKANKSGHATVKLLKTSPLNQKLSLMYALQTASAANHGQNTISVVNAQSGDTITCQNVAFKKAPTIVYGAEGGMNEWSFNCGRIDRSLGAYN